MSRKTGWKVPSLLTRGRLSGPVLAFFTAPFARSALRGLLALLLTAAVENALPARAAAAPGIAYRAPSPERAARFFKPARAFSISSDTLSAARLTPTTAVGLDHVDFDFRASQIRRVVSYRGVTLVPGAVYSPSEWAGALAAASLDEARRKSANEALVRAKGAEGGSLTKFEIPVKFPKAVSGLIGQGVNINVSGREAISFSGESSFLINPREQEIRSSGGFPDLDMRQQLQINMDGQIGDKINVLVQHDSESQTPLSNRIKLNYTGYEDEIIKKVEIGNTQLTLPGNQFVSFSGRQQGLFGAKIDGKAGKLDFTAVVSKQEGRTDRETFRGQSSESVDTIPDFRYEQARFFSIADFQRLDSVRVFLDDNNPNNDSQLGAFPVRAHIEADPARPGEKGDFHELQRGVDYSVSFETGVLAMDREIPQSQVLAVSYVTDQGARVGAFPSNPADSVTLKLLLPAIPKPDGGELYERTWELQLRNFYRLNASQIQREGFSLRVFKRIPGQPDTEVQDGRDLLRVFGLDSRGPGPNTPFDGLVDDDYAVCRGGLPWTGFELVDYETGLIQFPGEQPFDPLVGQEIVDCGEDPDSLLDRNTTIYNKREVDLRSTDQKYFIEVRYRGEGRSQLSLGRSNILEGSEVVRLGSQTLERGVDYRITYEIGLIEFLSDRARQPDADISVDFEYAPFLAQQQKSLFGAAGTYKLSPSAELSSIWLFESSKTPYKRPRIGQEPSRAVVGGLAGQWRLEPDLLTEAVDRLPFFEAKRSSNVALSAEVATSFANPNTRDNIYIDDMEGIAENSNLGNNRRQWSHMSLPRDSTNSTDLLDYADRFRQIEWYNPRNAVTRGDLNPSLEENERDDYLTVLEVALKDGSLNNATGGPDAYGGIIRLLSSSGVDYSKRKFIEVWINDFQRYEGRLHIDLGTLSEDAMWQKDVPPNGTKDTEDKNGDGRLDDSGSRGADDEDTGLDSLFNVAEVCVTPECPAGDPTGDNYFYNDDENTRDDYSRINGTENNGFLDSEDLGFDKDFPTMPDERFFRYTVDLNPLREEPAAYGNRSTGWRLYRIPLCENNSPLANVQGITPSLQTDIKHVRVWFSGVSGSTATFQIASIEVVGNRWLEGPILSGLQADSTTVVPGYGLIADTTKCMTTFDVRVIDNKTGEDYQSPPIDLRETNGTVELEQSLVLDFDALASANSGYALKDLFQEEDYSRYRTLNFWYQTRDAVGGDPWLFFRLGYDSLNFYEFRTPLVPGIGWQEVKLDLAELTRVKLDVDPAAADSVTLYRRDRPYPYVFEVVPGGEVASVGAPTLTRIGSIEFGVVNRGQLGEATSGEVWLNELRLIDVQRDPGGAGRIAISAELADLGNVNAGYSRTDDEFRSLGGARTGRINTDLRLGGTINLHKFAEQLGVSLPVNWNWGRNKSLPDLLTGSDVVLVDRESERTENRDASGSVSLSRSKRSDNLLMYHTIDAMNLSLSGNMRNSFSPTRVDTSDGHRVSLSYTFRPKTEKKLRVYRSLAVAWFPTSLGLTAARDQANSQSTDTRALESARTAADSANATRVVNTRRSSSSYSLDASPVTASGITTTYNFSTSRDHSREENGEIIKGVNKGLEVGRSQTASIKYTPALPKFMSWTAPNVTYDTRYTESSPFEFERATRDSGLIRPKNVNNDNKVALNMNISTTRLFGAAPPPRAESDSTRSGGVGAAFGQLGGLARRLQEVRATVSLGRRSTFDRILERPGLGYQLGLDDVPEVEFDTAQGRENRFDRSRDVSGRVSSGVMIVRGVSVTGEFSRTQSKQERSRNNQEQQSTTWPRLSVNWGNVERLKVLQPLVESATATVAYQQTKDLRGTSIDSPDRSETTRKEWSPLLSIDATLVNGLRVDLTTGRSSSDATSGLGGGSESRENRASYQLGFEYRIQTARKVSMPLLGKGEPTAFTSELGLGLNFNLQTDTDEVFSRETQGFIPQADTRTWNVSPRANYSFSKNVSGSLDLKYGENHNLKNESLSRRTIGVSAAATLRF